MKYLLTATAIIGAVVAQGLGDLPQCGQACIQGMLAKAQQLGCSPTDALCLCRSEAFGDGIRDCTSESCPSGTDVQRVYQYGVGYCQQAAASASSAGSSVGALSATNALNGAGSGGAGSSGGSGGAGGGASSTAGGNGGNGGGAAAPYTTINGTPLYSGGAGASGSAVTTVAGAGGSGSVTLYSNTADAMGTGAMASASASEGLSSAEASISSSAASASGSLSSAVESAQSSASSAASGAASGSGSGSASSSGGAALPTMAANVAGLAGLAAVMLL